MFDRKPNVEKLAAKRDVSGLIEALEHKDRDVRNKAASTILHIGQPAVEPLIETLVDTNYLERARKKHQDWVVDMPAVAAELLARIGKPAIEPLIRALRGGNIDLQCKTIPVLEKLVDASAVDILIKALKDRNTDVRGTAAQLLGKIHDKRGEQALIQALKDKSSRVRCIAAQSLGKMRKKQAVEPLIDALDDEDKEVRANTALALGRIGDVRAIEPLIRAAASVDRDVSEGAREALEKLEPKIKDVGQKVRYLLTRQEQTKVVQLGAPAVEPLIEALRSESAFAAAEALGKIGGVRAVEALIEALKGEAVVGATQALGETKDARAVEPLVQMLRYKDPYIQRLAIESLAKIGDLRAAEEIVEWFFKNLVQETKIGKEIQSWKRTLRPLFADYTDLILKACAYTQSVRDMGFGEAVDEKYKYDTTQSNEAIHKLCEIPTQISSNLLHKVSVKKDIKVRTTYYDSDFGHGEEEGVLSFENQRAMARQELERRGNPSYDSSVYLKKEAWKL